MNELIENNIVISIIVPIYNAMPYLIDCLKSICGQSYANIEIILVDDGSSDGSEHYIDDIAKEDIRVNAYHGINKGLVSARKKGIEKATGDYFVFVDSDDVVDSDMVEKLVTEINKEYADILLFGIIQENEDAKTYKNNYFSDGLYDKKQIFNIILPEMITGNVFFKFHILPNLVAKCINRRWFNKCVKKVDSSVKYGEDADLTYQIIPQAESLRIIDLYPYHYINRNNSMVSGKADGTEVNALNRDLKSTFTKLGIYNTLEDQLNRYISFVWLIKKPEVIVDLSLLRNRPIALYGAGGFGQSLKYFLGDLVSIWVDKNYIKYQKRGMDVWPVDGLNDCGNEYDAIFIAISDEKICEDVAESLCQYEVNKPVLYVNYSKGKLIVKSWKYEN